MNMVRRNTTLPLVLQLLMADVKPPPKAALAKQADLVGSCALKGAGMSTTEAIK